ncbi:MAG: acyltransferase, partial [Lysobacteraceae bacterium]
MGKKSRRKQSTKHAIAGSAGLPANSMRRASGDERYPALSGLRGLAALGVFCMHAYALTRSPKIWPGHDSISFLLAWPMKMGWAGVDVFFTLSAFLLTLPFVRAQMNGIPHPGLRGYAARRALRILPAYGLQLLVLLALIAMGAATGIISHEITAVRLLAQPLFLYDISWPGVFSMQWP